MASINFSGRRNSKKNQHTNRILMLMILPAAVYYFIFSYLPMAGSILAFKKFNYVDGIFGSPWAGFTNFKFLFLDNKIFTVVFNTLAYNTVFMIVNTVLEISFAIFLVEIGSKYYRKLAQSIMFLPYFISWVIVGAFLYNLFNYKFGSLNTFLTSLGFAPLDVYSKAGLWKYIIVTVNAWKWVGYGTIIYLAAILGIDIALYESAKLDGANKFKIIRYITLPLIIPQLMILLLFSIGSIFRGDFQMFYQVTGNNPLLYGSTDVIDTFVVRAMIQIQDVGMSSAAGLAQSVVCFFILIASNYLVRKYRQDYALF
jgi:putative aldouronate transport system permease protein